MLKLPLMTLLLMAVSTAAADAPPKLEGNWIAISAQRNGKAAKDLVGHTLTFSGDRFTIKAKDKLLYAGTFKVNTDKQPAQIDFTHTEGERKGKAWQGIFGFDGDVLQICDNGTDDTKDRPTTFMTRPESGHVLVRFKRGK